MKHITLLLVVCLCGIGAAHGQDAAQAKKRQAFVMPSEIELPVIAVQPDCPLKFENVKVLHYVDRGMADSFELRNRGTKPIRDYTVAVYSSIGNFWVIRKPDTASGPLIFPGALAPQSGVKEEIEIVPLTDELRRKFKLNDLPMQGITVFMVVRIEYADGTVYNNEAASKAAEAYLQKMWRLSEQ